MQGIKHAIDVRMLGPDDAVAYKEMRVEAAGDPSFGIAAETESAYSVALLRQALRQDDGSYVLGAFTDSGLIGMVGYGRGMKPDTSTLFGLFVKPGFRGQSIGALLCQSLFQRHPGTAIRLEVLRTNTNAIDLYRRLGFADVDRSSETLVMIRPPDAD